jgi:arabinose-5-phosphate isomerase
MNMLDEMDRVFQLEIDTLVKIRAQLDDNYAKAAELLFGCQGKVVVTGMGKSGLIAQKIAATMISTGTEAAFLHPAEARHGDAGVLRKGDLLLAISKSGETDELLTLLPYMKQIGVSVVSITAAPDSTLARNSDLILFTPVDEEACPLNLAPTSSTTAALVVGDALAMTLMRRRGITPENFALFHPGGQLGKRLLLTVADTMRGEDNNPVVEIGDTIQNMLYEISNKRCGAVSIIDDKGRLMGLVTDRDIRRILEQQQDLFAMGLADIMNRQPTFVYSDVKAIEALQLMEERESPFVVLPVLDRVSNIVVGMVHLHDLVANGL